MKKMKTAAFCAALLGFAIFALPSAQAAEKKVKKDEKVDMASYTCENLLKQA